MPRYKYEFETVEGSTVIRATVTRLRWWSFLNTTMVYTIKDNLIESGDGHYGLASRDMEYRIGAALTLWQWGTLSYDVQKIAARHGVSLATPNPDCDVCDGEGWITYDGGGHDGHAPDGIRCTKCPR